LSQAIVSSSTSFETPARRRSRRTPTPGESARFGSAVAERLIQVLERRPLLPASWRRTTSELETEFGAQVYPVLLFILTHLDFPPRKAKAHWGRILEQWDELNTALGGGVELRVAVLHYFLRIQRKLKNPAIVEIKILQQTHDSTIVDELTHLYNFRYFQDRVTSEAKRARRYDTPLALLMVDVDDFKAYNDTHGHLRGNVALKRLATAMRDAVRDVDVVARYGGEEFAVLLPSTPKNAALGVAEKVRRAVEQAGIGLEQDGSGRPLTVSIGAASVPGDADDALELIERADQALYVAKSMGKNRVKPYSDERREFVRIDTSLIGRFNLLADKGYPIRTLNVSESGVLFGTKEPLKVGSMVQLSLKLDSDQQPVHCLVRIVRVIEDGDEYEVGARIIDMERDQRRSFLAFVARHRTAAS
jgi:diguanylate cyclase (GGDEF)-like protein